MKTLNILLIATLIGTFSISSHAWTWNSAQSYCSIKRQFGYASDRDPENAKSKAIRACVDNGGIPECCRNDAKIVFWAYASTAHCALTKKTGMGIADTQARANELAIAQCVENGGISSCCRNGLDE